MVMLAHKTGRLENLSYLQEQPRGGRYNKFYDICTYVCKYNHTSEVTHRRNMWYIVFTLSMRHGKA